MSKPAKSEWFDGIRSDLQKRLPVYISDWTDIFSFKIVSSSVFIFFTSIAPGVTFSLFLTETTNNEIGAIEILVATSLTGIIFSILGGQPLNILGVTGPVAILTAGIYTLANALEIKFFPFFAWSQVWAGLMHIIFACGNYCSLLKYVTEFSCDIFGVLVALIYLYTGFENIGTILSFESGCIPCDLFQFIVAMGSAFVAIYLTNARSWKILSENVRSVISDYGATISIVLWPIITAIIRSDLKEPLADVPTLYIPKTFQTSNGRDWIVDLSDIPGWAILLAALPGLVITVLFFFDHNIGSIMAQHRDFGLQKSPAFHWDFAIIGVGVLVTGLLGLPPTNSLIPQSPLHVKSLTVKHRIYDASNKPTNEFKIEHIYEQRVTNLLQSIFMGVACFPPFSTLLSQIPVAVLVGLFLFLGVQSFEDNEFFVRCYLFLLDSHHYDDLPAQILLIIKNVPKDVIFRYTVLQICLMLMIFASTFTVAGSVFPIFLSVLAAIRFVFYPSMFQKKDLELLDRQMLDPEAEHILVNPHEQIHPELSQAKRERRNSYVKPPRKYSYL